MNITLGTVQDPYRTRRAEVTIESIKSKMLTTYINDAIFARKLT